MLGVLLASPVVVRASPVGSLAPTTVSELYGITYQVVICLGGIDL